MRLDKATPFRRIIYFIDDHPVNFERAKAFAGECYFRKEILGKSKHEPDPQMAFTMAWNRARQVDDAIRYPNQRLLSNWTDGRLYFCEVGE